MWVAGWAVDVWKVMTGDERQIMEIATGVRLDEAGLVEGFCDFSELKRPSASDANVQRGYLLGRRRVYFYIQRAV